VAEKAGPDKTGPKVEFLALQRFAREIEKRYLDPYPEALGVPNRREQLDVAAYVVLLHGYLENFVEGLSLWILGRLQRNWIYEKRATRGTASLLLSTRPTIDYEENDHSTYNVLRLALEAAKEEHSAVIKNNHGTALKDVRKLLSPLGVDIPADENLQEALRTLVTMRHEWAHQSRFFGAKVVKSAHDARKTGGECMELAKQLYLNVAALKLS
jgi:hypothetical protein